MNKGAKSGNLLHFAVDFSFDLVDFRPVWTLEAAKLHIIKPFKAL